MDIFGGGRYSVFILSITMFIVEKGRENNFEVFTFFFIAREKMC